jgi:hypothetical protein
MAGWADYIPSWFFLPIARSVFRPGYGFGTVFDRAFTEKSAAFGTEIWTGVLHRGERQHQIFTNKAESETLIKPKKIVSATGDELFLSNNLEAIYLDGDRKKLAEVTMASASIPWMVKPVPIGGVAYSDGGSMFSSPLSVLANEVARLKDPEGGGHILRLFYFSTSVMTDAPVSSVEIVSEITNLVQSASSSDIRAFLSIVKEMGANWETPEHHSDIDPKEFGKILYDLDATNKHYAVLLYPSTNQNRLDLTNITARQMTRCMRATEENFRAFIWTA